MSDIRLGLVGAGWVAQEHMKVLRDLPGVKVVGVTSRTPQRREKFAAGHEIEGCACNIKQLVKATKPDALLIMVSEDQMFKVTQEALSYKLPLFIEKPAGLSPQENAQLLNQAKKFSVATMVGFNRRFYSVFEKGLEIIRQNGGLRGVFVEGHERMWKIHAAKRFSKEILDKWIFANSTHTIDLLRFFGGEVRNFSSIKKSVEEKNGDQFAAIMELDDGAIGQYSAHWYSPGGWRVVLYGDGVTVEFKPLEKGRWLDRDFETREIEPDEVDEKYKPGFYRQMEAFVRLVKDGVSEWPMCDLADSLRTMELAQGFLQKDTIGQQGQKQGAGIS